MKNLATQPDTTFLLSTRADEAKCLGIGCAQRENCLRYLRLPAIENQIWCAFWVYIEPDAPCAYLSPHQQHTEASA